MLTIRNQYVSLSLRPIRDELLLARCVNFGMVIVHEDFHKSGIKLFHSVLQIMHMAMVKKIYFLHNKYERKHVEGSSINFTNTVLFLWII
jgi:hypothetical protein